MITTKKLLVTLIATVMLSICFGTTAFAAELVPTETQPVQTNTEDVNNTDNNIVNLSNVDTETGELPVEDVTEVVEELLTSGEYYLDEQGQAFYEEPSMEEEIIIDEVIDEVTEDTSEAEKEEKEPVEEKPSYAEKDLRLLASLIYAEAGNQSYNGMLGVANVVLNRVKSDIYWHANTVKEVIYDHKWSVQFAVTIKNKKSGLSMLDKALKCYDNRKFTGANPEAEKKAMNRAIKAAKAALEGNNNIGDYLCFQNKRSASSIKRKYSDYKIIGDHIFYRLK